MFKYGEIRFSGAKVGDAVRYIPALSQGQAGAILQPRGPQEINAILHKVAGSMGYVEIRAPRSTASALAESGSAVGITISLPISSGGSLKIL